MGHAQFSFLNTQNIIMLNKGPSLVRDIKGLDQKASRELFKAAVIYVGKNQEDENAVLNNSRGSAEYDEFVKSLGWKVNYFMIV